MQIVSVCFRFDRNYIQISEVRLSILPRGAYFALSKYSNTLLKYIKEADSH